MTLGKRAAFSRLILACLEYALQVCAVRPGGEQACLDRSFEFMGGSSGADHRFSTGTIPDCSSAVKAGPK